MNAPSKRYGGWLGSQMEITVNRLTVRSPESFMYRCHGDSEFPISSIFVLNQEQSKNDFIDTFDSIGAVLHTRSSLSYTVSLLVFTVSCSTPGGRLALQSNLVTHASGLDGAELAMLKQTLIGTRIPVSAIDGVRGILLNSTDSPSTV